MSKLEELVCQLCPNGVEYRTIGEICNISRGVAISKQDILNHIGEYPVYSSQTENNGELGKINTYAFDGEYLTWTTDGANAGTIFYRTGKFNVTNVCGLLQVVCSNNLARYIFHVLSVESPKYVRSGMGNPKLMSNVIGSIKIPTPPLAVQQEIVRILDNFTELTTELITEITARKKQYTYYRDTLLTFGDEVKYRKLGDVGSLYGGLYKKNKSDFIDGNAKFITYKNVTSNLDLKTDVTEPVFIGENEKQNTVNYGDVLFTRSAGTPDKCGMSSVLTIKTDELLYLSSFCFGFRQNDNSILLPGFSKYLFRSKEMRKQISHTASGGTRFNVSKEKIKKVIIPIPPIYAQREISRILDNFTELITELTTELSARQKQYEYYRGKLLTFGDVVEYVPLSEVLDYEQPTKYIVSATNYNDSLKTPVLTAGQSFILGYTNETTGIYNASKGNQTIIFDDFTTSFHWVDFNFKIKSSAMKMLRLKLEKEDVALFRYVYHCMKNIQYQPVDHSRQWIGKYSNFPIPIPPLSVQREIVAILDRFDTLCNDISSGLPAEIKARQQQYEYYSDKLLTFKKFNTCEKREPQ